jgi:hypothetical protein
MTAEQWTAFGTVGSLFVFAAAAFAAIVQLRHMRRNNQLQALLAIQQDFRDERLQRAFAFVQCDLAAALQNPAYRGELSRRGFVDGRSHPEMDVCNWFNEVGMLVRSGFVDEQLFFPSFARLVIYSWSLLSPAIALLRRERGSEQYDGFEYLAMRASVWHERNPHGSFPPKLARMRLDDPWLEPDLRAKREALEATGMTER